MQKMNLAYNLGGALRGVSYNFTFLDLQTTTGAGAKAFLFGDGPFSQGSHIFKIFVKTAVAFSGGALSAMTASVGKNGGSATAYTTAFDCFAAVSDTNVQETKEPNMGQLSPATPNITFTPTGDTCANCTAGSLFVTIIWLDCTTPTYTGLYTSQTVD